MRHYRVVALTFFGLVLVARPGWSQFQCNSTATSAGGLFFVCPARDGGMLGGAGQGSPIIVTVRDNANNPIPNISRCDFWVIDCDPLNDLVLCGPGALSANAEANTDQHGMTRIVGPASLGGCASGLAVVVQGIVLTDPNTGCTTPICLPFEIRSPDMNGDLVVSLIDLSMFGLAWPPAAYDACADFNLDGTIGLQDLATFAQHFGHACAVPPCP